MEEENEKIEDISIIDESYKNKESAFDQNAEISFVCSEESFGILRSDDDVIDKSMIDNEVEQELRAELSI